MLINCIVLIKHANFLIRNSVVFISLICNCHSWFLLLGKEIAFWLLVYNFNHRSHLNCTSVCASEHSTLKYWMKFKSKKHVLKTYIAQSGTHCWFKVSAFWQFLFLHSLETNMFLVTVQLAFFLIQSISRTGETLLHLLPLITLSLWWKGNIGSYGQYLRDSNATFCLKAPSYHYLPLMIWCWRLLVWDMYGRCSVQPKMPSISISNGKSCQLLTSIWPPGF